MLLGLGCRSLGEVLEFADYDPDRPKTCRDRHHDDVEEEVSESIRLVSLHGEAPFGVHYTPCNSCDCLWENSHRAKFSKKINNPCDSYENVNPQKYLRDTLGVYVFVRNECYCALRIKVRAFDTKTCFCSYATITNIPRRWNNPSNKVSQLNGLRRVFDSIASSSVRSCIVSLYSFVSGDMESA